MVIALMVLAAGTVGISAWVALITARSAYAEAQELSIQRRVILGNSRAMAREYILRNVLTEFPTASSVDLSVADTTAPYSDWGNFTLGAVSTAPLASTQLTAGINRFSPANNNFGYYVPLDVDLSDGVGSITSRFYAKSRSLNLSGTPLLVTAPAGAPNYTIRVAPDSADYLAIDGASHYAAPTSPHVYRNLTTTYSTRDVGPDVSFVPSAPGGGLAILGNFPSVPMTSGKSGTDLGYTGVSDVIDNALNPQSLKARILASDFISVQTVNDNNQTDQRGVSWVDGDTIEIDLNEITLNNVYVEEGVTTIIFRGQETAREIIDAKSYPATMIVVSQASTALSKVEFYGQNFRRLFVGIKNPTYSYLNWHWMEADEVAAPADYLEFRLLLTVENVDWDFSFPGNVADVNVIGGLHIDRRIIIGGVGENMTIRPESIDPGTTNTAAFAERYSDRMVWLETFVP